MKFPGTFFLGLIATLFTLSASSQEVLDPKFYANSATQRLAPAAFALQPESRAAVQALLNTTLKNATALARALSADPELMLAFRNFKSLTLEQREAVLKKVFAIECQTLKILPPELVLGPDATPGSAYFDFDPNKGGTGRVLMAGAFERLKDRKYKSCLVWSHARNNACFFYEAMGGVRVATRTTRLMGELTPEIGFGWKKLATKKQTRTIQS